MCAKTLKVTPFIASQENAKNFQKVPKFNMALKVKQ
jgi:hypothetical protein